MHRDKVVCCHCLKSGKGYSWTCGIQGHKTLSVGSRIRFPSYKAKKKEWLDMLANTNLSTNPYFIENPIYLILITSIEKLKC